MDILSLIGKSWGWTGIEPVRLLGTNAFGNVMLECRDGTFWRICPEELSCEIVAPNREALNDMLRDPEFVEDWHMTRLRESSAEKLGGLPEGHVYCLKVPAVLGGAYDAENVGTISLEELMDFAGTVASRIKDLPDGAQIEFEWL